MEPGTAPRPAVKGVRMKRRRNTADQEQSPENAEDCVEVAMDADASHAQITDTPHVAQPLPFAAAAAAPEEREELTAQHLL